MWRGKLVSIGRSAFGRAVAKLPKLPDTVPDALTARPNYFSVEGWAAAGGCSEGFASGLASG